jgi:hypothetical protein
LRIIVQGKVEPCTIHWIDPSFKVGLLGMKWNTVSSNTTVALFEKFLTASPAFQYNECDLNFKLHSLNPQDTCKLHYIIEPLNWVTEKLLSKVVSHKDTVTGITRTGNDWTINMSSGSFSLKMWFWLLVLNREK